MLNLLVLMAGPSNGFKEAGYLYPKNLVELNGAPLVQHVIQSLNQVERGHMICLIRHEENTTHHTGSVIRFLVPNSFVMEVHGTTKGAACTALLAIDHINNDDPLVIVNGDQILSADLAAIIADFIGRNLDGGIVVFEDVHPRWSFVKCDEDGLVIETAEKRPISNLATAGFYYFKKGSDFVKASMSMILKDAHVNGQYYVCPAYNELILAQARIGISKISKSSYFSLATPQGVRNYEQYLRQKG